MTEQQQETQRETFIDSNGLVLITVAPRYANKYGTFIYENKLICLEGLYANDKINIERIITHDNGNKYCRFTNSRNNKKMWVLMEGISGTSKRWRMPYCPVCSFSYGGIELKFDMHNVVVYCGTILALSFIAKKLSNKF